MVDFFMSYRRWLVKILSFFYFASLAVLLAFLPIHLKARSFTDGQVGILFAIGPFVSIISQVVWGYLSDRLNTVKKILLVQLVSAGLSSFLVFHLEDFYFLIPAMFLFYTFTWPIIPLMDSLTLSLVRETGENYGSYRWWGSLGFALTALSAGRGLTVIGLDKLPYIYWGLISMAFIICLWVPDVPPRGRRVQFKEIGCFLKRKEVVFFLLVVGLMSMTNKANDSFQSIYIQSLGGTARDVGLAWTVAPISEIPVFWFGARLLARFHELTLLTIAAGAYALRWTLFSLVPGPQVLMFVQVLHSITFGLFFFTAVNYMGRLVLPELRASGQGLLSSTTNGLAGVSGSLLGGLVMSFWGPRVMYQLAAGVALATFLLLLVQRKRLQKVKKQQNL